MISKKPGFNSRIWQAPTAAVAWSDGGGCVGTSNIHTQVCVSLQVVQALPQAAIVHACVLCANYAHLPTPLVLLLLHGIRGHAFTWHPYKSWNNDSTSTCEEDKVVLNVMQSSLVIFEEVTKPLFGTTTSSCHLLQHGGHISVCISSNASDILSSSWKWVAGCRRTSLQRRRACRVLHHFRGNKCREIYA